MAGEGGKMGPGGEWKEAQRHRLGPSSLRVDMKGVLALGRGRMGRVASTRWLQPGGHVKSFRVNLG